MPKSHYIRSVTTNDTLLIEPAHYSGAVDQGAVIFINADDGVFLAQSGLAAALVAIGEILEGRDDLNVVLTTTTDLSGKEIKSVSLYLERTDI